MAPAARGSTRHKILLSLGKLSRPIKHPGRCPQNAPYNALHLGAAGGLNLNIDPTRILDEVTVVHCRVEGFAQGGDPVRWRIRANP